MGIIGSTRRRRRHGRPRPTMRVVVVVVLAALLAGACSSDLRADPDPTATTATTGSTTTSPTTSTGPVPTTTDGSVPPTSTTEPASTTTPTTAAPVPVPTFIDENGFDDHSVPAVSTVDELMALSRLGVGGQSAMKFTLPEFDRPADAQDLARAHLMDGNFYSLHDEWFWYRLLNGQPVPEAGVAPLTGQSFSTIDEIYTWATSMPVRDLPLGLSFTGDRLYSDAFYDAALHGDPRRFGVGAIVRFPDPVAGRRDHWLIELEYSDTVTPELVAKFFTRLAPVLPAEIGDQLQWVVRSPQHEQVAQQMEREGLPYGDRIVHFSDLVPAGTVAVYSEGVTAGRLLYVGEGGAELGDAKAGDIVVTEHVPDWLPQANALITSDPQTPLAHVNLLARNRGIPNASQAGIVDDAGLRQAARVRAHAIVVTSGGTLKIALISREQYDAWSASQRPARVSVPPVDLTDMAMIVDLTDVVAQLSVFGLTESEVAEWRTVIGGKSAGFLTLLATPGLTPPPDPLAITVRPYLEHLAPIRATIEAAIGDRTLVDSPRARWLALEGPDDYGELFPSDDDAEFAASFIAAHKPGTALGDVLAAGGVRGLVESRPIDPSTLATITDQLEATYGDYDTTAGLRFRSSSSVEDIEGFNGAGLYTSYTGYLEPQLLDDEDDHDKTIEHALLRAWSSYWTFEAFEERRLANIDHLSGAMGLTVHARFDDDLERNNGVATFTYLPSAGPTTGTPSDDALVEINVQTGSIDVTNPDTEEVEFPEVIRVTRRSGEVTVERVSGSTVLADGDEVLDDDAVDELFEQVDAVADVWRTRLNDSLEPAQRVQTVVLDFEFKTVEPGWPHLVDGAVPYPSRLVLRQVRSLDPGLRALPDDVRSLAVPVDILMRASLIERLRCTAGGAATEHIEVTTDPLLGPDMGYADQPLIVGTPAATSATCTSRVLYASPDRSLLALVAGGGAFVIIG